jgi:hypothetical protein
LPHSKENSTATAQRVKFGWEKRGDFTDRQDFKRDTEERRAPGQKKMAKSKQGILGEASVTPQESH